MAYVNFVPEKICKRCGLPKFTIDNFNTVKDHKNDLVFRNICKECQKNNEKAWHQNNKDRRHQLENTSEHKIQKAKWDKTYRENNIDAIKKKKKKHYQANKKEISTKNAAYHKNNRHIRNNSEKDRKQNNPAYKLKVLVSSRISSALKSAGTSKRNSTFTKYVPYSMQELKEHLEKQFEPWMTWQNWGKYDFKSWVDNDPVTWTWQLDHIIPRSKLLYTTMEDDNFKRCWALENLRPLSAKQNIIDGANKSRHQ